MKVKYFITNFYSFSGKTFLHATAFYNVRTVSALREKKRPLSKGGAFLSADIFCKHGKIVFGKTFHLFG